MLQFIISYLNKFFLVQVTLVCDNESCINEWKVGKVYDISGVTGVPVPAPSMALDPSFLDHIEKALGDPDTATYRFQYWTDGYTCYVYGDQNESADTFHMISNQISKWQYAKEYHS